MKTLFKKLVVVFFIFIASITTQAQSPVSVVSAPELEEQAAENLAQCAEIIENGQNMTIEAKRSADNLQKTLDAINKVSNSIFAAADTYEILYLQSESLKICVDLLSNAATRFNEIPAESMITILTALSTVMQEINKQTTLTKKLLTSGVLKMDDGQRLAFLKSLKNDARTTNIKLIKFKDFLRSTNQTFKRLNKRKK